MCSFLCNRKLRCEDAQNAEMELIAAQYRGRARVLQANFVPSFVGRELKCKETLWTDIVFNSIFFA